MTALGIASITLFALSVPMRFFFNRNAGSEFASPEILQGGAGALFLAIQGLLTYLGLAGIWYVYGWQWAVGLFILKVITSRLTPSKY